MKNKQDLKLCNYTLVELLAAMAVFAIIMLVLMGFFSSAQKIWTGSNNKVIMFEDARVAMNLMTRDLQSSFYSADYYGPFYATNTGTNITQLDFVAKLSEKPSYSGHGTSTSTYAEVRYWWDSSNYCLKRAIIGDCLTSEWNFYAATKDNQTSTIFNFVPTSSNEYAWAEVIPRVVDFEVTVYVQDSTGAPSPVTTSTGGFPYAVLLKLTLLDKASFAKWQATNLTAIKDNNKRTFTKLVLIGDRGQSIN